MKATFGGLLLVVGLVVFIFATIKESSSFWIFFIGGLLFLLGLDLIINGIIDERLEKFREEIENEREDRFRRGNR